jgi:cytochrome c556
MPKGMQDAGTAMHRAASRLALEAQTADVTGDVKGALGLLGDVIAACNGCHAGYRLK